MTRRISNAAFIRAWNDASLTTDEMAAMFGVHRSSISRMGKIRGLPPRKQGVKPVIAREPFASWWMAGVGSADIAKALGISRNYTTILARRFGLPNRPQGARKVISLTDYRAMQLRDAMAASARETEAALHLSEMKDGFQPGRWPRRAA
ncbi:MAG: hypothetical protein ACLGIP_16675 [Alphaproteobacteria bacterium]